MEEKIIDVAHVAVLARLSLTEEQTERMTAELEEFVRFARILSALDPKSLDGTEPTESCRMRSDVLCETTHTATDLLGSDRVSDGYVCVPLTVEEE